MLDTTVCMLVTGVWNQVREQAGLCIHDTLQSFRGTLLLSPASKNITDLLMNKYPPPRTKLDCYVGVRSLEEKKAMHTLVLVIVCLGVMSAEERGDVLVYFKDLLKLHQTYVTTLVTEAVYKLCLKPSLSADVSLDLLLDLMCSLCLSVSQYKTHYTTKTIAGLFSFGVPKIYSLNKQICNSKLPIVFDTLIVLLDQSEVTNASDAGKAFMGFIAYIDEILIKQGVERALMNANIDDGSQSEPTLIEKLCATFKKLLAYCCTSLRYLVLEIVSTMFYKLGVYSSYLMKDTVKTLADMLKLPDKRFLFKEEVKLLLETVVEKCGLDAITTIIPQEHMELLAEINEQLRFKSVDASSPVSRATTSRKSLSQCKYKKNDDQYNNLKRKFDGHLSMPDHQWTEISDRQPRSHAKRVTSKGILGASRMTKKLKL